MEPCHSRWRNLNRRYSVMGLRKSWSGRVALCMVVVVLSVSCSQGPPWETYVEAGKKSYREGKFSEAERQFTEAVKKAEQFGPQDLRLALSLNNLGEALRSQGKLIEAEPMYKRAVAIREQSKEGDPQDLAFVLNNLAALYYAQERPAAASLLY